jgi:hypothetical protein
MTPACSSATSRLGVHAGTGHKAQPGAVLVAAQVRGRHVPVDSTAPLRERQQDAAEPSPDVAVRPSVQRLIGGRLARAVWENEQGGLTFEVATDSERCFVKWAPATSGIDLSEEVACLSWAAAFSPVPRVLSEGADDAGSWIVTAALRGENAVSDRWRADPGRAVSAIMPLEDRGVAPVVGHQTRDASLADSSAPPGCGDRVAVVSPSFAVPGSVMCPASHPGGCQIDLGSGDRDVHRPGVVGARAEGEQHQHQPGSHDRHLDLHVLGAAEDSDRGLDRVPEPHDPDH